MNYFFKYLLPQLLEYFNNDNEAISELIPQAIRPLLLEYQKENGVIGNIEKIIK